MKRKERIQEKKTKEKSNPSSSTKKKEYIYIYKYPSSVTKRIESVGENGEGGVGYHLRSHRTPV